MLDVIKVGLRSTNGCKSGTANYTNDTNDREQLGQIRVIRGFGPSDPSS